MKKIVLLFILCFLFSCMNPFSSRSKYYYNNSNKKDQEINKDYPDIEIPPYDPNDKNDPFNIIADWNRIDYKFNGNELYDQFMKISFLETTVPVYKFFIPDDGREWKETDGSFFEEYTFNASKDGNTTESPILDNPLPITPMTIYRYGKNPLVKYNGEYNKSERIKRFFFIRAKGNAVIPLDNYLIAIDTYSKYIFAYAKITDYDVIFEQKAPTEFEAIEHHHLKLKFYEYDPIGYIDENKNIILYKIYEDDMTRLSSDYVPRYSPEMDIAPFDKYSTGRSPYTKQKK